MKKPKHYSFHPICLLFPRMTDEELRELADDIRQLRLRPGCAGRLKDRA